MQELVIVLSDLYSPPPLDTDAATGTTLLPGLGYVTRFASRARLDDGWRSWLARWSGRNAHAIPQLAPATVAAIAAATPVADERCESRVFREQFNERCEGHVFRERVESAAGVFRQLDNSRSVWLAEPVHLIAGLTSLHLDRRGVLRLLREELQILTADFAEVFRGSGFALQPLGSGNFLLHGPRLASSALSEPARWMGEPLAAAFPQGAGAPPLRRLAAEVEMWLHGHAVNAVRIERGAPPVTTLWFWGDGPPPLANAFAAFGADADVSAAAFGSDAFLSGLWAGRGGEVRPLPPQLADVFGYSHAPRGVLVMDVGEVLRSDSQWTLIDALRHLDDRFISPATQMLRRGELRRLSVVANDRHLSLSARDGWKLWRQRSPGLTGLG